MRPDRATRRVPRASVSWLALSEASALLGVSPATLRRWSDAGRVSSFTTPGGHRRFSREALERLLPSGRETRPSVGAAGATHARIVRAYRGHAGRTTAEAGWLAGLADADRDAFRRRGRQMTVELLAHLDAADPTQREDHLREAASVAAEQGRAIAALGRSLSEAVETFLRFRTPFLDEILGVARRRGFDTRETTDLLQATERALDRLLVATMTGHSVARVARRHRASGAPATGAPGSGAPGTGALGHAAPGPHAPATSRSDREA